MTLTERQNEAYEFIRKHLGRHHRAPTLREIGGAVGIASTNGVTKVLDALERKGYIEREKGQTRGIHLLRAGPLAAPQDDLPLLAIARDGARAGRLRSGKTGHLALDPDLLPPDLDEPERSCLMMRVPDDGMDAEGGGIRRGDLAIVHECILEDALADRPDGALVAVFVRRTFQIRHARLDGETLYLSAAHKHYSDAQYDLDGPDLVGVGEVVGIVRSYLDALR